MPKLIDYAGRFAFFEEACFALVRDHGPQHLSRHRVAHVLGTSISTVRRLLNAESDLRNLALSEVGQRRRSGRYGRPPGEELEDALWLLCRLIPDAPHRIAEELVWWRLNVAAPTTAILPLDAEHLEEGPLHHRFAVANFGFVPIDVLALRIERAAVPHGPEGVLDPVVSARGERDADIADAVAAAVSRAAPDLSRDALDIAAAELHALVEGGGVGVCLGRLAPEDAVAILRSQLGRLTSVGSSPASP
jgi:hypothetical protein